MQINLEKQFRFAHQGHTVRSYGPGELTVGGVLDEKGCIPQDAADYALEIKLAKTVKEKKKAPAEPKKKAGGGAMEFKAPFRAVHKNFGKYDIEDAEGRAFDTGMEKEAAETRAAELNNKEK